jgi:hypothetical protein
MEITLDEYEKQLQAYLKEQGENQGSGFFGAWGWYATKKNEFDKELEEKGVTVTGKS